VLPRQLFRSLPWLLLLLLRLLLYAAACTARSVYTFTPRQVAVQQPHAAPDLAAATRSSVQHEQLLQATTT
jgi:hypothetical protein